MAVASIKVSVIDVGQGQCTFVEVYGDDASLLNTLLFDCGSDKKDGTGAEANLDYIVSKTKDKAVTFDCVFFSHSDKDHISLMANLLQKFLDLDPSVKPSIGRVWYGGSYANYRKRGFNILNEIYSKGYCPEANVCAVENNKTDYDKTKSAYGRFKWRSADKSAYVVAIGCNLISAEPDFNEDDEAPVARNAQEKNHVSMVCGLYFGGVSYVICGDATNVTMGAINILFKDGTTVFDNNKMTTMPHHGSRATGLSVRAADKANAEAVKVVKTFNTLMKSASMSISSFQKHKHSSLELVSLFPPANTTPMIKDSRLTVDNNHLLVLYDDVKLKDGTGTAIADGYHNVATTTNIFGTNYYLAPNKPTFSLGFDAAKKPVYTVPSATDIKGDAGAINTSACWVYTTLANGTTTLEGREDMSKAAFTSAATVALVTALESGVSVATIEAKPVNPAATTPRQLSKQLHVFR